VALLHHAGWSATFVGAAAVGVLAAVLVFAALRDAPPGTPRPEPADLARVRRNLADTWREPGTRIGLYTHLVTQFSGTVFALLQRRDEPAGRSPRVIPRTRSRVARCRATLLWWNVPTRRAGGRSSCGPRSAPRWPR